MLAAILDRLPIPAARRPLVEQMVRYGVTGGIVTTLGAGLYVVLVERTTMHEQIAVIAAYLVCVAIGYVLHSRWSFAGHGSRDDPAARTFRFFAVSLVSYALNAGFTWAMVRGLELPRWSPAIPILFVTPLATFTLNRIWVFR